MSEPVRWPTGLKSLHEMGLPVEHLGMKEFAERYPPRERLKHIATNNGSANLHVKTETGLRADVPPQHKLMLDPETGVYSIWSN